MALTIMLTACSLRAFRYFVGISETFLSKMKVLDHLIFFLCNICHMFFPTLRNNTDSMKNCIVYLLLMCARHRRNPRMNCYPTKCDVPVSKWFPARIGRRITSSNKLNSFQLYPGLIDWTIETVVFHHLPQEGNHPLSTWYQSTITMRN